MDVPSLRKPSWGNVPVGTTTGSIENLGDIDDTGFIFNYAGTTTAIDTFLVSDLISIRGGVLCGTGDLTTAVLQVEAVARPTSRRRVREANPFGSVADPCVRAGLAGRSSKA